MQRNGGTASSQCTGYENVRRTYEKPNYVLSGVNHQGDPFRPLWDLTIVQRIIYSLDWLPDPRCIVISFDDGTLRILSLTRSANDAPVTAKPFVGTQHQGLNNYMPLKDYAIWSVQVSRRTGMVAYWTADGTVFRFQCTLSPGLLEERTCSFYHSTQLTTKEVEKGDTRNRYPRYLCGSLTKEDSALTVFTPLPDIPFPMQKAPGEWCNAPSTIRGFLSKEQRKGWEKINHQTIKHLLCVTVMILELDLNARTLLCHRGAKTHQNQR